MSEINEFTQLLNNTVQLQPLHDIIDSIMNLPDESLTEVSVESIKGMISGAVTDRIHDESVKAMQDSFIDQNFSRVDAINLVNTAKKELENYIESINPSPEKQALLQEVCNNMYSVFDEVIEKYHRYNIELPMTLEKGAYKPTYAHDTDAAADLYAMKDMTLKAHSISNLVDTGVRIALPEGWSALVLPRSSMGLKTGLRLSNSVGLIDADYRGPIGVMYDNISDSDYEIKAGDRIAQMLVVPSYRFKEQVVDILPTTERGEGGFGSSGK